MTHKNSDEYDLENLLNNAPKLSDHRSKEEVLKRLQADARLQDNPHLKAATNVSIEMSQEQCLEEKSTTMTTRKRKNRKMPLFISIASVFVLTILVGGMLYNQNSAEKLADPIKSASITQADQAKNAENASAVMETSVMANHARLMSIRTSVYEEDLVDATVFRIGLAGGAAESVPLTFVIPNERVADDFGGEKPTTLQLYKKYAPQIDEKAMGFAEYHPYKGELKEQGKVLVHVLPEENEYDGTSANVSMYKGSLVDTFSDYKEIALKNADGTAYEFSQAGQPSESIQLTGNHYNYYLYKETNGAEYLSPDFHQTFETVKEALIAMKDQNNDIYIPVVPEGVAYAVTELEDGVAVTFDEPLDLTTLDAVRATQLIEAMMLTAASFDEQLLLENVVQDHWEGFDLTKYLPIPVGANKQYMQ